MVIVPKTVCFTSLSIFCVREANAHIHTHIHTQKCWFLLFSFVLSSFFNFFNLSLPLCLSYSSTIPLCFSLFLSVSLTLFNSLCLFIRITVLTPPEMFTRLCKLYWNFCSFSISFLPRSVFSYGFFSFFDWVDFAETLGDTSPVGEKLILAETSQLKVVTADTDRSLSHLVFVVPWQLKKGPWTFQRLLCASNDKYYTLYQLEWRQ